MSSKRKPPAALASGGLEVVAARSARVSTMLGYLADLIRIVKRKEQIRNDDPIGTALRSFGLEATAIASLYGGDVTPADTRPQCLSRRLK